MENLKEKVLAYNREMREALLLIYNELNNGQQKKLLKNPAIKALLTRYKIVEDDA